jgi:adenylate cyclase
LDPGNNIRNLNVLSKREQTIATRYSDGETYTLIAEALFIAPSTVRNHLSKIYRKLDINSKVELINVIAQQAGDTPGEPIQYEKPSIAVLPFTNMSDGPGNEYFSDGITEDIITGLSRFRDLFVIARSSTFVFKGQSVNVSEVASKLGVRFVVEGSVRKDDQKIRITAQLIDAESRNHIWAEHYDRKMMDLFEVQDEVTQAICATLMGRVEQASKKRIKRKADENLNAYDYFLQGRESLFKMTPSANKRAKELFEKAVSINPEYAAAYAGLAEAYLSDWVTGWSNKSSLSLGWDYAHKSVSIDDSDSRAHTVYGAACYWCREYDEAEFHLQRALTLNPGDTRALVHMARYQFLVGEPERSVAFAKEASVINPFGKIGIYQGQAFYAARQYSEAIQAFKTVQDPIALIYGWLAMSYIQSDRQFEAKEAAERFETQAKNEILIRKTSEGWGEFYSERWPFKNPEDLEHMLSGLRKAGLA